MTLKFDVRTVGPLFTKDVKGTVRENAREWLAEVAEEGEELVREGTPVESGRLRDSIHGRVRSLSGRKWLLTAVVTPTVNLTMPGHKGYATYIETGVRRGSGRGGKVTRDDLRSGRSYRDARMFRRAAARLRAGIKAKLNLTKGLE